MRLQPWHRFRRLVAMRRDAAPTPAEVAWAAAQLSSSERALFSSMSGTDRAHVIRVARSVVAVVDDPASGLADDRGWMVRAALLHDVGKGDAPLGPIGRSAVTVAVWAGAGSVVSRLDGRGGMIGRAARYATYPERGAEALAAAGSDPRVVAWAREHHLPPSRWTVPGDAGLVLSRADDEG